MIYNLDAITGQWKFNKMCREEGGARFYAAVEKDVGWEVVDQGKYAFQPPFSFGHVAFVRYTDKAGQTFDVRVDGYIGANERRYIFSPADMSQVARYRYQYLSEQLAADSRFSKTEKRITDLVNGQVVAAFVNFGFEWTKPERVILAAPTGKLCSFEENESEIFYRRLFNPTEKN